MLSYNNATGASPSAANDTVGGYMNMEAQLPQRHTHLRRQKVAIVEGVDKNIPYSVFFFSFALITRTKQPQLQNASACNSG